jgi:hypothetical protein
LPRLQDYHEATGTFYNRTNKPRHRSIFDFVLSQQWSTLEEEGEGQDMRGKWGHEIKGDRAKPQPKKSTTNKQKRKIKARRVKGGTAQYSFSIIGRFLTHPLGLGKMLLLAPT